MRPSALSMICLISSMLLILQGCGVSQFPVKAAKGKVVCKGKPVTSGSITFTPVGTAGTTETGKPASGTVGTDGSFVLSTFDRFDGAIIGKHLVQFSATEGEDASEEDEAEVEENGTRQRKKKRTPGNAQSACVQRGEIVMEVTADGPNDFTIELTAK